MIERHAPDNDLDGNDDKSLRDFIKAAGEIADLDQLPPSTVVQEITAVLRKRVIVAGLKSRFDVRHRR